METPAIALPSRGKNRETELYAFAHQVQALGDKIGFKISARGWAYQLEDLGLIDKSQFNMVQNLINECRERGHLPIDFVAEEESRKFSGIEEPTNYSPVQFMRRYLNATLSCEDWYTPDWWDGEEFYVQMLVEKIDLKTLFSPVCEQYHIPIATSKGWSSMLQRAEYALRFSQAEDRGLRCVLLYCGDHDPDGLRISEFIRGNLRDLEDIVWSDGSTGYDPTDLVIDRFGLNYDFITANRLSWIENLVTGSGKNLADPAHPNHSLPYVQEYLAKYGARKCEANALVVRPAEARELCRKAIEEGSDLWGGLGRGVLGRFAEKREKVAREMEAFRERTGLKGVVQDALKIIDMEEKRR